MQTDPYSDPSCEKLAQHLYDFLNNAYPELAVVRSWYAYDVVGLGYEAFPLLKVYRQSDNGNLRSNGNETQAIISYSLVLPDLDKLAPILAWVARTVKFALQVYKQNCGGCSPVLSDSYRVEYRNLINEATLKVHSFVRIYITFTEN